jgi:hypothetical protein
MVAAICGFDRSWESCKKKHKVIYTEYKNDKTTNEISDMDRHQECKWFDLMCEILLVHVSKTKFQQVQRRVKMKAMKRKDHQNCKNLKLFQSKKRKRNSKTS